ncbi:peptidase domain-containing ABC transporter [Streptacidiphilus sp. PB12-B1b]|uniref:peptidase domain-containing ABC transporter n=1 Tax=Streptacidiphilus sp. PB12-B1b TaxID=2705012 RepID=UPI0015F94528|nr:peptidase domain-containing ABC transporter [Streptacidiphilus sp. PB12-B1b]QMU78223.1 peptidase domain-containing ABC transporter [Streptacidiphilus sp. PB12-B1b]
MTSRPRFRAEALAHRYTRDGLGPVLGRTRETHRPKRLRDRARSVLAALRERRGRSRVPVCLQTQVSDCGPACLVMTLRHHGIEADLAGIRARTDSGRNGASARTLLDTARQSGLPGRGVRTDLAGLRLLPPGSILFWNFSHFVVLERSTEDYTDIVDPSSGRRRLSPEAVTESFTGVALEFTAPLASAPARSSDAPAQAGPWRLLRHVMPRGRELRGILAASGALMALEFVLPVAVSLVLGRVIPDRLTGALWLLTGGLGLLAVLFFALQTVRSFMLTKRQAAVERGLTWGVVEHLVSLPYDFFTVHNSGDLALRVRTSSTLNQILSMTAVSAAFDGLLIVVYLVAVVIANPVLAAVVIGLVALQAAVMAVAWRRQSQLSQEVLERQTQAQGELVELLESITSLKSAGTEAVAAERWSHALVTEVNKRSHARRSLAATTAAGRAIQFCAPMVVLVVGVWRVLSGHDSPGATLAFMALTASLFAPLESVFDTASQLATVRPALVRLDDILSTAPEPAGRLLPGGADGGPLGITVRDLVFRYRGAPRPTLADVDLRIEPGQFTAVLGRSGSGKSTLGMLLAGLHLPTSGTVTVGGCDLTELDGPSYRRQIAYVNQNAHLFSGTIRDNIAFGAGEIAQADLIEAVRLARVHEEIAALPMGYDTLVGPGGHGLSGGQRQRIVLARALARRPRLLILDEATSALDPALEREIFQGLLTAGTTVVAVAHRLTVLDAADQVLVVQDGRIVQSGTPDALKADGGEYLCLL